MEDVCDCDTFYKNFNEMISFFLKMYSKFLKIKGKDITNKKSFINMKDDYDALISLTRSLVPKGNECLEFIKECPNKHPKEIEDIKSKVNKVDELIEKINNHYEIIKKQIPQKVYDEEEEEDKEEEIQTNKINIIKSNISNKPPEKMSEKEILENDKKAAIVIQDLLKDEEYKRKNNEDKKHIIKTKNIVNDILKDMEVQLNKDDEIIDHVEENVDNSLNKVEKGTEKNLKEAAETAVHRRRLKYQLGLGAAFCAAGTIVPGIGNIAGAALGGLIGYGLYRIDKHRLKKIEKKYQEQDNNDNK